MGFTEKSPRLIMIQRNVCYPIILLAVLVLMSGLTLTTQTASAGLPVHHHIDFNLELGRLYTLPVSHSGPKLLIGVGVWKKMNNINKDTILECKEQSNARNYRDLFRTRLSVKLGEKGKDFVEIVNKTFYSEYFTIARQQVWTCATQLSTGERIGVIRVKNELVGTGAAEIRQLSFRDGVKVSPRISTFLTRTAHIEEIKFLDPFNGEPVEYVGKVTLPEKSVQAYKSDSIPEVYGTLHVVRKKTNNDGSFREILYDRNFESDDSYGTKPSNGLSGGICLGSPSGQEYGAKTDIYKCRRYQGLNPLPFKLRTRAIIQVSFNEINLDNEAKYFEHITPISDQVWYCEHQTDKVSGLQSYDRNLKVIQLREIEYSLEEGRAYRSVVGSEGLNIKVNSKWVREIGERNHVAICRLQATNDATTHAQVYGTKIRVLIEINNREESHAIPKSLQKHYWHVVKQRVWTCSPQGNEYTFIRVVNQLEGLKAFYEVQYYEGVELHRRYLGNGKESINIIETKYLDPTTYEVLKYEGILQIPEKHFESSGECTECSGLKFEADGNVIVLENRPDQANDDCILESVEFKSLNGIAKTVHDPPPEKKSKDIDTPSYKFLFKPVQSIGAISVTVDCYVTDEFDEKFYPSIKQHVRGGVGFENTTLTTDSVMKYMTCERMDVFICSKVQDFNLTLEGFTSTNEEPYKFYMVKTDIRVEGDINIYHEYGVEVSYPSRNRRGVKVTNFFDIANKEHLKFEGKLKIHGSKYDYSNIKSGTVNLKDEFAIMKQRSELSGGGLETQFKSSQERFYQMQIDSSKSEILYLGSSAISGIKIGNSTHGKTAKCRRDSTILDSQFITEYRTKCYSSNGLKDSTELFKEHFQVYRWEVWNCYIGNEIYADSVPEFKRIVTHFNMQLLTNGTNNIKEIRYYDGMSIEVGINVHGLPSWDFTEIKYLKYNSPHSGVYSWRPQIAIYHGKIELEAQDSISTGGKFYSKPESHSCLMDVYGHSLKYLLFNQAYLTLSSHDGRYVRIGDQYQKELNGVYRLRCQELNHTGFPYRTKAYILTGYPGKATLSQFTEMSQNKFEEYFKVVSSRLWECKPVSEQGFKLNRVETLLQVKKMASTWFFYDGVIMDSNIGIGSFIEEIKYIDPNDGKLTKYEGFIRYETSTMTQYRQSTDLSKLSGREIFYQLNYQVLHAKNQSHDGIVLHIGTSGDLVEYGKRSDTIVCKLLPYNRRNIIIDETKKCYPRIIKDDEKVKRYSAEQIKSLFPQWTRQIWRCSANSDFTFFKTIDRYEISEPISLIYYHDGISTWTREAADGKTWTVFRDASYCYDDKYYRFEGRVIYIKPVKRTNFPKVLSATSVEVSEAPTSEQFIKEWKKTDWYKRWQYWDENNKFGTQEPLQTIIYNEPSPRKSIISFSNGNDIRVGSHWQYEIGSSRDNFQCDIEDAKKYDQSVLLTKLVVIIIDDEIEITEKSIDEYFKVKNQEVSICESEDKQKSFLRVVTTLEGKVPVRNIEYYDGVEFISTPLGFAGNTANMVEHKYLDRTTFKPIKFCGTLVKKSGSSGWLYTIRVPVPVFHGHTPPGSTARTHPEI
ncbi:hypothetical protein LSTR_LSTR002894 [Laodelphax striatellus]|uniref:Uncharacterized protein n=1 Tax=Laodelphax striatellus TaxID=195883 RepID=A0A482XTD0_LAOST|nr:hypothetical protein LSTR_LSTR002894 [Laodelphax striatellus]